MCVYGKPEPTHASVLCWGGLGVEGGSQKGVGSWILVVICDSHFSISASTRRDDLGDKPVQFSSVAVIRSHGWVWLEASMRKIQHRSSGAHPLVLPLPCDHHISCHNTEGTYGGLAAANNELVSPS
jgi:hypothetical protein